LELRSEGDNSPPRIESAAIGKRSVLVYSLEKGLGAFLPVGGVVQRSREEGVVMKFSCLVLPSITATPGEPLFTHGIRMALKAKNQITQDKLVVSYGIIIRAERVHIFGSC